jgi:hypothetical protein
LLPNGQQTWVRTFHRRPETKQDGYCPVMQDEARQHAHALLRRWAGIDTIDEAYRRFFWLVVTNPAARGAPALKEQAQLIEAIEEYARMVPNPTPEEVKTYVLSVLRHEIETGVSLMCAKLRNSNVTIEDLQMGRVILDPDGTTRQPLDDSGDATATLI